MILQRQIEELQSHLSNHSMTLLFITSFLCAILFGFFSGTLFLQRQVPLPPIQLTNDIHIPIPTIEVLGVTEDGALLVTSPNDHLRVLMGEDLFELEEKTLYQLPPSIITIEEMDLLMEELHVKESPCSYIASTTGKVAYPRGSTQAKKLKTKRCFTNEEEAITAGLRIYGTDE